MRTEGQTVLTKLIVAFRNSVEAPTYKRYVFSYVRYVCPTYLSIQKYLHVHTGIDLVTDFVQPAM
jgi:hypothetical protein